MRVVGLFIPYSRPPEGQTWDPKMKPKALNYPKPENLNPTNPKPSTLEPNVGAPKPQNDKGQACKLIKLAI